MTSPPTRRDRMRALYHLVLPALSVAAFSFLCTLGVGVVLVVGAKLQVPDLGAGASPWSVLQVVVVVSLGALGAPVDVGDVEVGAIPLAGIAFVGVGTIWATRRIPSIAANGSSMGAAEESAGRAPRALAKRPIWARLAVGLLVGAWLAALAALASWAFRIGSGPDQIRVSALDAGLAGAAWGWLFGASGALLRSRAGVGGLVAWSSSSKVMHTAMGGAVRLVAWFGALCFAVVAVGGTIRVARSAPSPPAAAGSVLHGLAFAPNLAVTVGAVALGAPVEAGFARLDAGSSKRAPTYSLWDWGGAPPPIEAQVLVVLPLASAAAVGPRLRRELISRPHRSDPAPSDGSGIGLRREAAASIALCSFAFASCLAVVAWLGEARLGMDVADRGFARVTPDASAVFLLALGWSFVGLLAGWSLDALWRGRRRRTDKRG